MGKNPQQKPKYDRYLSDLGERKLASVSGYCQICGQSPVLREIDRRWFPLAAGGDSDPCTLPGLKGKIICISCLSAVVILPLGCRLCRDGPYFIHVVESDLQVEAVSEGVEAVQEALVKKVDAGLRHGTSCSGRLGLLEIVSGSRLWDHTQPGHMNRTPQGGATIISFNNRGTGPRFDELHLPVEALEFFGALIGAKLHNEFLSLVTKVQKFAKDNNRRDYIDQLCDGLETRRSLAPLLFAMKKSRLDHQSGKQGRITKEEIQMLQIYEEFALKKKERFDTLERIARKINAMPERHRDSFIKRLNNIKTKERFLELVKHFCKSQKLTITNNELRVLDYGPTTEVISLLYLLCFAEE